MTVVVAEFVGTRYQPGRRIRALLRLARRRRARVRAMQEMAEELRDPRLRADVGLTTTEARIDVAVTGFVSLMMRGD